jgi:hypothetical protein
MFQIITGGCLYSSTRFLLVIGASSPFLRRQHIYTCTDTYRPAHTVESSRPMLVIRYPEWADSSMLSFRYKPVRKMPARQSIGTHTDSTDSERPKAIRLGVDLIRVMPDGNSHYAKVTQNDSDKPRVIRMGIGLARKLFHPQNDHSNSYRRVDRIFYVHASNEQHTLHRCRTVEDLKRPAKLDISKLNISKPMTSPPAPDETLMHRFQKRQADWRKRSISMKTKRMDNVKRWSLKTWKAQAGRGICQNATSLESSRTRDPHDPVPGDLIKRAKDSLDQGPYIRERPPTQSSLRSANLEISVRPVPIPANKRVDTFRDRRWDPSIPPTTLDVIEEQPSPLPSPLYATRRHAASTTHIPRQHNYRHQIPRKSASTSVLRPAAQDGRLAIPSRSRMSNAGDQRLNHPALRPRPRSELSATDQRHIHPALRSKLGSNASTIDQRNIHPALRTQPRSYLNATDQRHIHPALRNELGANAGKTNQRYINPAILNEPGSDARTIDQRHIHPALRSELDPSLGTADQRHIHPALRREPSIISGDTLCTISTTASAQPIVRSNPRVRIIPPSTLIDPEDTPAVYATRAFAASKPPELSHQQALVQNMNASRAAEDVAPLDLHPLLSNRAQDYVALQLPPLPPPKPTPTAFRRHMSMHLRNSRPRATKIEQVEFLDPSGAHAVRLISPPGLGALACAELWAGGKYKRHKTVNVSNHSEQHRYTLFPDFETDNMDSMIPVASHSHSHSHGHGSLGGCNCTEHDSYKVTTDERWKSVGIGCSEDGRWVVELWEPEPEREPVAGAARSLCAGRRQC